MKLNRKKGTFVLHSATWQGINSMFASDVCKQKEIKNVRCYEDYDGIQHLYINYVDGLSFCMDDVKIFLTFIEEKVSDDIESEFQLEVNGIFWGHCIMCILYMDVLYSLEYDPEA